MLFKYLVALKMEKKDKGKDFNQNFTTILNIFPTKDSLIEALSVEYYTSDLHPSIGLFSKRAHKMFLAQNFKQDKEVEK
jgi:hypothetical protein